MRHALLTVIFFVACVDRADVGSFSGIDAAANDAEDNDTKDLNEINDGEGRAEFHLAPATTQLAAGGLSTCAIDSKGGVVCWGDNRHGALGVGALTPTTSDAAVPVAHLESGVRAVAGGPFAQCAILDDGSARCWGDSVFGDVGGAFSTVTMPWPHDKMGLSNDVAQIGFGFMFACALTTKGRAKCWGLGGQGQLGVGSTDDAYIARDVGGVTEPLIAISPSMGGLFVCAVTSSGKVLCWGQNGARQLGTLDLLDHTKPVLVAGLDARATAVGAGRAHACALLEDGAVACWGSDEFGQLGRGVTGAPSEPHRVEGVASAKSLAVGGDHACAIFNDGHVACWGSNAGGQIKEAPHGPLRLTEMLPASFSANALSAGFNHTCAMTSTRHVVCVGSGDRGQTGKGDFNL
ncbi:MAG: hypothetical protein NVS3B20_13970 [Polyangiales bacterium]